jgi:hypothetical protein
MKLLIALAATIWVITITLWITTIYWPQKEQL